MSLIDILLQPVVLVLDQLLRLESHPVPRRIPHSPSAPSTDSTQAYQAKTELAVLVQEPKVVVKEQPSIHSQVSKMVDGALDRNLGQDQIKIAGLGIFIYQYGRGVLFFPYSENVQIKKANGSFIYFSNIEAESFIAHQVRHTKSDNISVVDASERFFNPIFIQPDDKLIFNGEIIEGLGKIYSDSVEEANPWSGGFVQPVMLSQYDRRLENFFNIHPDLGLTIGSLYQAYKGETVTIITRTGRLNRLKAGEVGLMFVRKDDVVQIGDNPPVIPHPLSLPEARHIFRGGHRIISNSDSLLRRLVNARLEIGKKIEYETLDGRVSFEFTDDSETHPPCFVTNLSDKSVRIYVPTLKNGNFTNRGSTCELGKDEYRTLVSYFQIGNHQPTYVSLSQLETLAIARKNSPHHPLPQRRHARRSSLEPLMRRSIARRMALR